MTLDELAKEVKRLGEYRDVRVLPDGSVAAVGDLMFTRAIFLGCNPYGWNRRFCYSDRQLADKVFSELQSEDDNPEGWTARRPPGPDDYKLKDHAS